MSASGLLLFQRAHQGARLAFGLWLIMMLTLSFLQANFTGDNSLVLSTVAETAQFTAAHGRSGVYPIAFFTSTASGSQFLSTDGQWLENPQVYPWHAKGLLAWGFQTQLSFLSVWKEEDSSHLFQPIRADQMPGPPWEGQLMCTL